MFVAHPEMFSLVFLDRTKHIKSICINKFHCVGCSSRKFDFHVGEISVQLNKYPILIECYSIDIDTKFFFVWSMWSNRMIRDFFFFVSMGFSLKIVHNSSGRSIWQHKMFAIYAEKYFIVVNSIKWFCWTHFI